MSRVGWLRRISAMIMVLVGLVSASYVLAVGYGPRPDWEAAQLRYLDRSIANGAADRMQQLFPEGTYFTLVLTGLAEATTAARPETADRNELLARARTRLVAIDDPQSTVIFGSGMRPTHGAFAAGWSLSLAVAIARASGDETDLRRVREGADEIEAALASAPSPFLASYPGQYWPCDTVVAVAALAGASALLPGDTGWQERVIYWRSEALRRVDPVTGLLAHRVDADGAIIEAPRGSSNSIIQAFWPMITSLPGPGAESRADLWSPPHDPGGRCTPSPGCSWPASDSCWRCGRGPARGQPRIAASSLGGTPSPLRVSAGRADDFSALPADL